MDRKLFKKLERAQQKKLSTLQARVLALAADWGDLDTYFEARLSEVASDLAQIGQEMAEVAKEQPVLVEQFPRAVHSNIIQPS